MNVRARLGGEDFDIELRRESEGTFQVRIGEERLLVEVSEPEPGVLSLLVGDGSYEAVVRRSGEEWSVALAGRIYPIAVTDPSAAVLRGPVATAGTQVVRSLMAGRVLDVLVSAGDRVELDHPLLVIEAMKMENEIRAPKGGVVLSVAVKPGQAVEVGAELMVVA